MMASGSSSVQHTQMLPPPVPKRSLLQRATSKLSSNSNRLSFLGKWKSASLADLTSSAARSSQKSHNSGSHSQNGVPGTPQTYLFRSSSTEFRRPSLPGPCPLQSTASIRRKSLRSSWRDLASEVVEDDKKAINNNNYSGVNRGGNRLSHVLKPVNPPVVPGQEKRSNVSTFLSRNSSSELRLKSDPSFRLLQEDSSTEMPLSPGRDSIGHDSTASCLTTESTSSGCRTSVTSTDSGSRHRPVNLHRSLHSSSSSIVSADRGEDIICPVSVRALMESGLPDGEVLNAWLTDLNFDEYCRLFLSAGYDMPTISRMTPEDLTAIGIQKPNHRKKLKSEISKLDIGDGLPNFIPRSLEEWLYLIRLPEYAHSLRIQGYNSIDNALQISVEDLEDVGILKLGHQKRFLLAVKKVKDLKSGKIQPKMSDHFSPTKLPEHPTNIISSFKNPMSPNNNNNNNNNNHQHQVMVENHAHAPGPHPRLYQPEVIQISSNSQLHSSPKAFPTPPSPTALGMPEPMQQFNSLTRTRYQPRSFAPNSNLFGGQINFRSFDDSTPFPNRPPQPPMRSETTTISGGGTLPRPRGLVRPMPVAKVTINNSEGDLNKEFDTLNLKPLKANFSQNDLNTAVSPGDDANCTLEKPKSISVHGSPKKMNTVPRSAGDVLNDIGSMLADLTDELDAMLHSEKSESNQVC